MKPKDLNVTDVTTCFYQGKYKEVLASIGREPLPSEIDDFEVLTFLQIGSLVFLGDSFDAKIIFDRAIKIKKPTDLFLIRCRFYLGVGCVRRSDYSQAVELFVQNLQTIRKSTKENSTTFELRFYAYQGIAFYYFFRGLFQKTKDRAAKAYEASFKCSFCYGQVLSLDLLGHALCQLGIIRRGIFELQRATEIAGAIGNGGILTALRVSILKYRAEFGISGKRTIKELNKGLQSLDPQDTYSECELFLELSRQLVLRGRGNEAQKKLEAAGELVYRYQNKRQSAIYNHRYAHLLLLRGEFHAALALTLSLRTNLNPKIDIVILRQTQGLEEKIRRAMGVTNGSSLPVKKVGNTGEDPLGDLIRFAKQNGAQSYKELKEAGLLGLIPQIFGIPIGASGIFLGPGRREILVVDGANVICIDKGVTGPMKKLMSLLPGPEFKSKEWLITQTWKYQYNPLTHDGLLHSTIGKLRKLLGNYSYWIEWSSEGYRLIPMAGIFTLSTPSRPALTNHDELRDNLAPLSTAALSPAPTDLNARQIKTLRSLKKGNFLGVTEYAKTYKVTKMTACRDLTGLQKAGLLVRIGRGRATMYGLREDL